MKKTILFISFCTSVLFANAQTFNYKKKLTPPNTDSARVTSDHFGNSVSISGNYAIVGAVGQDWDSLGNYYFESSGGAYFFEKNNGIWTYVKKITFPKIVGATTTANLFGYSVSISGNYAIVGAMWHDMDSSDSNQLGQAGAAYIFERQNGVWGLVKKITPPTTNNDRVATDNFGNSVSINGNYAIVGAVNQDWDSLGGNFKENSGAAYIFERQNGTWHYIKKLTPPNTDSARVTADHFGNSVSISGNYAIVGANSHDWDSIGGNYKQLAGSAYIFERNNGSWGYIKKITPPNTDSARVMGDQFGSSVAVSNDFAVIGGKSQAWDSTGNNYKLNAGAVYVFERRNGVWGYSKKLTAPNTDSARCRFDYFGESVAVNGNTIVVGSRGQAWDSTGNNYKSNAGAVYVFERRNGEWGYSKKLTSPNTDSSRVVGDQYGISVGLYGDDLIIGADQQDWDSVGGNYKFSAGAAYIFDRQPSLIYNNGWQAGLSPNATTGSYNCIVQAGTATISAGSVVITLTINSGATATLSGDFNVTGAYTNNGTVSGSGTIVLNGTSAQTIAGNGTTHNLTLNNNSGASISGTLNLTGLLTPTLGTLTTGGNLILKATGATTYGQIAGTGAGNISGNITAEYHIPGGGVGYRPICSPLGGATLAQLSDDYNLIFSPGNAANVYYFNEQTYPYWTVATGTNQSMDASAFSVYMGGTASWANPLPITMDITGTYFGTGNYVLNGLTRNGTINDTSGWHHIRNPWPSGFFWNGTTGGNITTSGAGTIQGEDVFVYDQSGGSYVAYDNSTTGVIPPFHPFTFRVTQDNTNVTFLNSGRATSTSANFFDKTALQNFIEIKVTDSLGRFDKAKWYTDTRATNGYDIHDGTKLMNPVAPNLYFILGGKKAHKEVWNTLSTENDKVQLNFEAKEAGLFTISFINENIEPGITVELKDKIIGAKHDITKGSYVFHHNLSNPIQRFELNFTKNTNTGIEEVKENTVYVGSDGNNLNISIANPGQYSIEIIDLLGRTVQKPTFFENTSNQTQKIPINGLAPGYYLVKVQGVDVLKTTKIFLR